MLIISFDATKSAYVCEYLKDAAQRSKNSRSKQSALFANRIFDCHHESKREKKEQEEERYRSYLILIQINIFSIVIVIVYLE